MGEPKHLINEITNETKNWAVRITVIEDIPTMICSNGSKLKRYIFSDVEGNEVVAAIYGADVDILSPMINLFRVYDISNADVKVVERKYKIISNPFQWNIRRYTLVRAVPEANPQLRHFLDSLTPFSKIADRNNAGINTTDIMGVLIDAGEIKQVNNGRNNVQQFTIIDTEKIPLCLSLWDDMIASEGDALVNAAKNHSVVVAKRLAIKTFDTISLSAKNCSSFAINPPIQAVADLMSWTNTLPVSKIDELKTRKMSNYTKELVTSGRMRTYTMDEVAKSAPAGDYWVRGNLQLTDESQKLYYTACSNCLTKIKADIGHEYTCFLCKKKVVACMRPLVIMSVSDHTNTIPVVAIEEVAETILQTTTKDMMRNHNMGAKLELESIKASFEGKQFLMLLRRTYSKNTEGLRRLLLISYSEESGKVPQILPTESESSSTEVSLSPLKRQLNQIAFPFVSPSKKHLTWNENDKDVDDIESKDARDT